MEYKFINSFNLNQKEDKMKCHAHHQHNYSCEHESKPMTKNSTTTSQDNDSLTCDNNANSPDDDDDDRCCCSSQNQNFYNRNLKLKKGYKASKFFINEMDCPTEEALIRESLGKSSDVETLYFDLINRTLIVIHKIDGKLDIEKEIAALGMKAVTKSETTKKKDTKLIRIVIALIFAGVAEFLSFREPTFALSLIIGALSLIAIAICGIKIYKKGLIFIKNRNLNMNALMTIAVTGALILGEFSEAAMVISLFALAQWLESRSLSKAKDAISSLLELTPTIVRVKFGDSWIDKEAKDVEVGAVVRVKPGEKIALDGVLESLECEVDQSPITGESEPILKRSGDKIFAGSINQNRLFDYKTTAILDDSTISRIIRSVKEASAKRAPMQRWIDKFASIYTPLTVLFALLVAIIPPLFGLSWAVWIERGLIILIIACPCALVISTPFTIVSALTAALRSGVVVKGGLFLEIAKKIKIVALDKTGTITKAKPTIVNSYYFDKDKEQINTISCALASLSHHPVSKAIASELGCKTKLEVSEFKEHLGMGSSAVIDGKKYALGNIKMMSKIGVTDISKMQSIADSGSIVAIAKESAIMAIFVISDEIKENSANSIESLKKLGITPVMLTGDRKAVAEQIAKEVGIKRVEAELLPEDKLEMIARLKEEGGIVAMVGDGINDTPALARADISFAMGKLGSDSAIESADVTLMDDDLDKIVGFVKLSQKTIKVLWQNIIFALGVKFVFVLITLAGFGAMWMAVLADVGTTLIVIANSAKMLKSKL